VLAIGYEGEQWAVGNNDYLAGLAAKVEWLRPIAYVADPANLSITQLSAWQQQGFVGITLYIFSPEAAASLHQVNDEVWAWLMQRAWLVSVNSSGDHWQSWSPVLDRHPKLRLLIAHLGLPPAASSELSRDDAAQALATVCSLAEYPQTYVKFSGLYALAQPHYDYPHRAAWPYAQVILEHYGAGRVLWASDFSPALEFVSFSQTVAVVNLLPRLNDSDRRAIFHDNLAHLLHDVAERKAIA
jgi:L-fuconolactonase